MSDSGQSATRRIVLNLHNIPGNMNLNRLQGNIGRLAQEILPDLESNYVIPGPESVLGINFNSQDGATQNVRTSGHHTHGPAHPQQSIAPRLAATNQLPPTSFVVDMGSTGSANHQQGSANTASVPDENQNNTATPQGSHGHAHNTAQPQDVGGMHLKTLWKWMQGSMPFLFLLFAKAMYDHRLGILVLIGLLITFYMQNARLKRYIAQREAQRLDRAALWRESLYLLGHMVLLSCTIAAVYYADGTGLHRSLVLRLPDVEKVDLWTLLWIVGITDFVIKFGAIISKACIAVLPKAILAYKKRGKYYMMLEYLAQFYRVLPPIMPWFYFLKDDQHGGLWFAILLIIFYALCKADQVLSKGKEVKRAFSKFKVDVSYGTCPSSSEVKEADHCCPICQDKFSDPVKLTCKHIFCEDCVSMWFDRERTCPMCRANIVDIPVFRDGSTSSSILLF